MGFIEDLPDYCLADHRAVGTLPKSEPTGRREVRRPEEADNPHDQDRVRSLRDCLAFGEKMGDRYDSPMPDSGLPRRSIRRTTRPTRRPGVDPCPEYSTVKDWCYRKQATHTQQFESTTSETNTESSIATTANVACMPSTKAKPTEPSTKPVGKKETATIERLQPERMDRHGCSRPHTRTQSRHDQTAMCAGTNQRSREYQWPLVDTNDTCTPCRSQDGEGPATGRSQQLTRNPLAGPPRAGHHRGNHKA